MHGADIKQISETAKLELLTVVNIYIVDISARLLRRVIPCTRQHDALAGRSGHDVVIVMLFPLTPVDKLLPLCLSRHAPTFAKNVRSDIKLCIAGNIQRGILGSEIIPHAQSAPRITVAQSKEILVVLILGK